MTPNFPRDFRFASPDWSVAIWLVIAVVAFLLWLQQRRSSVLQSFVSPLMQARLVSRPATPSQILSILCLGVSAVCFVIALMRPQFGLTYIKSPRVGAQIMFCLDVSKSMLAEDVAPNRLERAKADILDLIRFLDGDQVGLIGFAGRATVLCPLTTDYGFFQLILQDANPGSVGRGGTRLEEPLRKAMAGFRSESDVSRLVVLITDGEDHDSHPLDAAKEAIERGIRVIAIGFGDEAGSEIRFTDPATGAFTTVKDDDGVPVVSRLDGELLRELALATEGVYIPAGVGSLDLKSIYDVHIQPLVRGQMESEGRAVRREAFQWAILIGMVFLLLAVVLRTGGMVVAGDETRRSVSSSAAAILFACSLLPGGNVVGEDALVEGASESSVEEELEPRDAYNLGLSQIQKDLELAAQYLTSARNEAGSDGELRFRATYNMGWVEVNRADATIEDEPQTALEHLQRAAGWFRDAIRLRSDDTKARHNLEVVLRRIMELRDQIDQKDPADLVQELEASIQAQRALIAEIRGMVDAIERSDDPNASERYRREFQQLAVRTRTALSDYQDVLGLASAEIDAIQSKTESERSPEESIRLVQLAGVLNHLNDANQRLGQSRSQLRRGQASRAFRRASHTLRALKRARDQLRNPLEFLDALLADAIAIARETSLKTLDETLIAGTNEGQSPVPTWVTQEYLLEGQTDLSLRTDELTRQLEAGLTAYQERAANDASTAAGTSAPGQQATLEPQQKQFLKQVQEAFPFLKEANTAFESAVEDLTASKFREASEVQVTAIEALQAARERFADIRALIEMALSRQLDLRDVLQAASNDDGTSEGPGLDPEKGVNEEQDPGDEQPPAKEKEPAEQKERVLSKEIIDLVKAEQSQNLERMSRLKTMVDGEIAQRSNNEDDKLEDDAEKASSGRGESGEQQDPERQRFEIAQALIDAGMQHMKAVNSKFETPDSLRSAEEAVDTLTELRRLFFSLVEHLQDTARQQAELNDETELAVGKQAEETDAAGGDGNASEAAKLRSKQLELSQMSEEIAAALRQQAQTPPDPQDQPVERQSVDAQTAQSQVLQENAERAGRAAVLVSEAKLQMDQASEQLSAESSRWVESRPRQDEALQKLIEALQQLQPPQQQQQDPDQRQQQDSQQSPGSEDNGEDDASQAQQQAQSSQGEGEEENANENEAMDPARILQAVRDREAQRRRDKNERQTTGQVPVGKDW
ncbi:MAG: VWA domain-containing protein [Planctomycetota bacterium]